MEKGFITLGPDLEVFKLFLCSTKLSWKIICVKFSQRQIKDLLEMGFQTTINNEFQKYTYLLHCLPLHER